MTACGAGTANPNSGSSSSMACVACNADEISPGGSSGCKKCPAGSSCSSLTTSSPCAAQTYSLEGETTCTPCPAGSICPTKTQAPQVSCNWKKKRNWCFPLNRRGEYCYALFISHFFPHSSIHFLSPFFYPFMFPFFYPFLTIPLQTNHCQSYEPTQSNWYINIYVKSSCLPEFISGSY